MNAVRYPQFFPQSLADCGLFISHDGQPWRAMVRPAFMVPVGQSRNMLFIEITATSEEPRRSGALAIGTVL
jgi:hypothetical protein